MAESGCLRDGKFDNLECNFFINHGTSHSKMEDYTLGTTNTIEDATITEFTQGNGAAGEAATNFISDPAYTMVANSVNTYSGDASAATQLNLPQAKADTLVVLVMTGDMDEANAFTIQTYKVEETFAQAHMKIHHSDDGGSDHAVTILGIGKNINDGTKNELIYTPTASATNHFHTSSEIHFYCNVSGSWMVNIYAIAEGVGDKGGWSMATVT